MRTNNRRARNRNNVDLKNVKKNDTAKNNNFEKSKEKVGQSFNSCQGYGHLKSKCPTFLRSKGKAMVVTLSDDEVFDHKSESDQERNFITFTATAVVSEIETANENPSDGELSENTDLQEAYNKLCKIAAKDAMSVELWLKKINTLEQEKKNLLLKLFDANELLNFVNIENMTLLEKVKSLELELSVAKEQIDRTSTSKLDDMLNIQKSISDKTRLGFIEKGSSFVVHPSVCEVKVHKEEVLASRRIRVDLSESKPRNPNQSGSKKHHKP